MKPARYHNPLGAQHSRSPSSLSPAEPRHGFPAMELAIFAMAFACVGGLAALVLS